MSKKKRRTKSYELNGTIEVVNITKGNRSANEFQIIDGQIVKNITISGSIDIKSANYDTYESETIEKAEVYNAKTGCQR